MAITATMRQDIMELAVLMNNKAPGTKLLGELVVAANSGQTLEQIAATLAARDDFKASYPLHQTPAEFGAEWVGNILPEADADLQAEAVAIVEAHLNGGGSLASLVVSVQAFMGDQANATGTLKTHIDNFTNKVTVATYHTITKEAADEWVIPATVTSDAATVTAANATADVATAPPPPAKQNLVLTTAAETIDAGAGDDNISGVVAMQTAATVGTTLLPGDIINGGEGTDTLTINTSGDFGGSYSIQAIQANSVEKVVFNSYDTRAADEVKLDLTLMKDVTTVGTASGSANGDLEIINSTKIVDADLMNMAGNFNLNYPAGVILGTQTQNITLSNMTAGTVTVNGVETVNVTSSLSKNTLADLVINDTTALNISGDQNLTITAEVDFKNATSATATDGTVDASGLSGKLAFTASADVMSITGGTGDDTINMVGTLNGLDVINGGDGTDTVTMDSATLTTQFAQTSNVEKIVFNTATAGVAMDVSKLPAGVTEATIDLQDANDGDAAKLASTVTKADGMLINIAKTVEDAADANDSDGTKVTITNTTDSTADAVNIKLSNIGRDNHATTEYNGIDEIDIASYETVSITANTNALGTNSFNEVDTLTATNATAITVTGTGALEVGALAAAKVESFDASGLAGALTLTPGAGPALKTATIKMGGKSSTVNYAGNLNVLDVVQGGAGTADTVTATVTGLSATTGALSLTDVENLTLVTSGNNTLALAGSSGITKLQVTDNKQTITGFDVANTAIHLGSSSDESATSSEIDVTASDATGADDTLSVSVNTTNGAPTSIIDASNIENLALTIGRNTTGTNSLATLDLTTFEGSAVTVGTGALTAGAVVTAGAVALGTLHKNTSSLTSTNKAAVTASMANSTSAVTFTGNGTGIQNFTGGALADTFTIGSTGNIAHVTSGGAGTDTTNITVTTGFVDAGSLDTENVNLTVVAAVDPTLTTSFGTGVDNVTILGGNELSTFTSGTIVNAVKTVDAGSFLGNAVVTVANDQLDNTVTITGGALATDKIVNQIVSAATYAPKSTGVEILDLNLDEDITVNLTGMTGLSRVEADIINSKTATFSNVGPTQTVRLTDAGNTTSILEVKPVDATATDNAVLIEIKGGTIAAGAKLKTTDVETVTVKASSAESIDMSLATMTSATKVLTTNITGTSALTLSATSAQMTTIDASTKTAGGVTQTGRSATTKVTYSGGAGADTFIMAAAGDTMTGGAGSDTLDVNYAAVLGGISIDLSATGNQILTMDGGAISGSISGFESVDLSGYTGFGAAVTGYQKTGSTAGSTVTGSLSTDRITLGFGNDTVSVTSATSADADVVSGGAGSDTIKIADGLASTTTAQNIVDLTTPGNGKIANAGAFANYTGFENIDVSAETGAGDGFTLTGTTGDNIIKGSAGDDALTMTTGNDTITMGGAADAISITTAIFEANSAGTGTLDGGAATDTITVSDTTTGIVDADFRGITTVEALTLNNGANTIGLGALAKAAGILTVTGGAGSGDTFNVTKAFVETATLDIVAGGTGTDTISVSDSGAVDLTGSTINDIEALTVATDAGADDVKIPNNLFDDGDIATAATLTITGAVDTDNDTLTIAKGSTVWDAGGAEASAAAVTEAGEFFLATAAGNSTLVYWNEAGASAVTLTITGLDGGAVAVSGTDLVFTA